MVSPVCSTCLSQDRWLKPLKSFLPDIISPIWHSLALSREVLVCWECKANIMRMASFLKQSQKAQYILSLHQTSGSKNLLPPIKSFSRLTAMRSLKIDTGVTNRSADILDYRTNNTVVKENIFEQNPLSICGEAETSRNCQNPTQIKDIDSADLMDKKPSLDQLNEQLGYHQNVHVEFTGTVIKKIKLDHRKPYVKLTALNYQSDSVTIVNGIISKPSNYNVKQMESTNYDRFKEPNKKCSGSINAIANLGSQINDFSENPVQTLKIGNVRSLNAEAIVEVDRSMSECDSSSSTLTADELDIEASIPMTKIVAESDNKLSVVETVQRQSVNNKYEIGMAGSTKKSDLDVNTSDPYIKIYSDYVSNVNPHLNYFEKRKRNRKKSENHYYTKKYCSVTPLTDTKDVQKPVDISSKVSSPNFTFKLLTYAQLMRQRKIYQMRPQYMRYPFKCEKCIKGWMEYPLFAKHLEDCHWAGDDIFVCSICETSHTTMELMAAHYKQHFAVYQCNKCEYSHHDMSEMVAHDHDSNHGAEVPPDTGHVFLVCHQCNKPFIDFQTLAYHMERQHGQIIVEKEAQQEEMVVDKERCGICLRKSRDLPKHMLVVHKMPYNASKTREERAKIRLVEHKYVAHTAEHNYSANLTEHGRPAEIAQHDYSVKATEQKNEMQYNPSNSNATHNYPANTAEYPAKTAEYLASVAHSPANMTQVAQDKLPLPMETNQPDWTRYVRARVVEIDKGDLLTPIKSHLLNDMKSARPHSRKPKPPSKPRPSPAAPETPQPKVTCLYCPERFSDRSRLRTHTRTVHKDNCHHCGKLLMKSEMALHVKKKHPELMGFHKRYALKNFSQSK